MPLEEVRIAQNTRTCMKCGNYRHWYRDHNPDRSLPHNIPSSDHLYVGLERKKQVPNHTISFNTASVPQNSKATPSCLTTDESIGPMVDNGAPYSAIGCLELCLLGDENIPDWDGTLDALPPAFVNKRKWQYGVEMHTSESRQILGSKTLTAKLDCATINIRHLVFERSSQLVIGRNVTSKGSLLQMNDNCL